MSVVDFYEELDLDPSADLDTIHTAIRTLRRRYRQLAGSPVLEQRSLAEQKIAMLAAAEKRLADPESRAAYDAELRRRTPEAAESPPAPSQPDSQAPSGAATWIESAESYLSNGQARNAAAAAQEATRAEPGNVAAWTLRARAALELRDFQDAEFSASQAQRRSPRDPHLWGLLGDIYEAEQQYFRAEKAFAYAASLDAREPHWQVRVAQAMQQQGRSQEAEDRAHEVFSKYPDNTFARAVYGFMVLVSAESVLTTVGDSIYVTSKQQIKAVEKRLQTVRELESADPQLAAVHDTMERLVDEAKKRRFTRPGWKFFRRVVLFVLLGTWILEWILTKMFGELTGDWIWLAVNLALVWYTVARVLWRPQWHINKVALGPLAKTGNQ